MTGRPLGSRNSQTVIVDSVLAACPDCGQTVYHSVRIILEREAIGTGPTGQPRSHLVRRRVQCACGRYFLVDTHENRGISDAETSAAEATEEA